VPGEGGRKIENMPSLWRPENAKTKNVFFVLK